MKNPSDIVLDQQKLAEKRESSDKSHTDKNEDRLWKLKQASSTLRFLRDSIFKVEVTNKKDYSDDIKSLKEAVISIPKTEKVEVTNLRDFPKEIEVSNLKDIKIPEVKIPTTIIPDNKKELLSIDKSIKALKFPEVKIPAQKEVDFSTLIETIKDLKKLIKVPVGLNEEKTQKSLLTVLKNVESGLSSALSTLNEIKNAPKEVQIDRTGEIIGALEAVSDTIRAIEYPVPNFSSSWQHSLTMQAEDLACTYVWKMVGTKEVLDYKQFVGNDGNTYRKTFTYNETAKPTYQTEWVKQ